MRSTTIGTATAPVRHLSVVAEAVGTYDPPASLSRDGARPAAVGRDGSAGGVEGVLDGLEASVDRLLEIDWADTGEPAIRDAISRLHRQAERIRAQVTSASGELTRRQAHRINPTDPDSYRTRQEAERSTQDELADTLNITHSEAKDAVRAGEALQHLSSETRQAFQDGRITARHARKLDEALRGLVGSDGDLDVFERQLLAAARTQNITDFGRTCRDLVARHNTQQAQRGLDRMRSRRYGSAVRDADGMLHIKLGVVGVEAEVAETVIETFRDKDEPGEFRTTDQRTADAIFNALAHALRHADSTDHGNRPHVFVHVDADQLDDPDRGVVETTFSGTLPLTECEPLLEDSVITRIVRDADGQVIDVGRATRTVSGPTWRGILARDRRCTMCAAPPQRCQAAHLDRRWIQDAGTSVPEQGLLCWRCHRLVDRLHLVGRLENNTVTWYRPDGEQYVRFRRPA